MPEQTYISLKGFLVRAHVYAFRVLVLDACVDQAMIDWIGDRQARPGQEATLRVDLAIRLSRTRVLQIASLDLLFI